MNHTMSRWVRGCLVAVFMVCGLGWSGSLGAAQIRVNTLTDVANAADGLCSLREAITASDANVASGAVAGECAAGAAFPNFDVIRFRMITGIITPAVANGPLPTLTDGGVIIDGWSAPGAGPNRRPRIGLDGQLLGVDNGLKMNSTKNQVRGLAVVNFGLNGIRIEGADAVSNHIYGNVIGADPTGVVALGNNTGVSISDGATDNIIGTNGDGAKDRAERNIISGNLHTGVSITSAGSDGNRVAGNYIGTNAQGTVALANTFFGVSTGLSAANNIIGTDSSGDAFDEFEGNVISGNGQYGISHVNGNIIVAGNLIGLNAAGNAAIPNLLGIQALDVSAGDRIGTDGDGVSDDFERNVISGNTSTPIDLRGTDHQVAGNYVGTDISGTVAIPNGEGISADLGPLGLGANMTIGGADERFRNVISGNAGAAGVNIIANDVTVECNFIGTDVTGTLPLGNVGIGVNVTSGLNAVIRQNVISFNSLGAGSGQPTTIANDNIIAGNTSDGFSWSGAGVIDITNNWWGDASGPTHAGNPGGLGDTVLENGGTATYNPWLTALPTLCAVAP